MKYIVRMKVDCRVDMEVDADNEQEAFEKAKDEFMDVELGDNLEYIDSEPVNCTDENGDLTDYNG